ncbi:hypothetical protein KP509_15G037800 [Ceratopteris richardii]|nr:hypothetical protein KP509_15G037800 [Ceratopteris richardii]
MNALHSFPANKVISLLKKCGPRLRKSIDKASVRAFAMEVAEEEEMSNWKHPFNSFDMATRRDVGHGEVALPLPSPPHNNADDISLHNPLLRLHRMGCGWLGVIMEWDGVIVEDDSKLEREAWLTLAQDEGRRPPPAFILRKAEGMKIDQAVSEVLCWSRDPKEMRRLSLRWEEIFQGLHGGIYRQKPGARAFVLTLRKYNIPIALAISRSRKAMEKAIEVVGLKDSFSCIVSAEDVYRGKPDPEMYMYGAQMLGIIPERCIVIGNSNSSIEAAHDTFMKCIAVAGKHPTYELGAADLVITRLDCLSLVDLKNLASLDAHELLPPMPLPEPELDDESIPHTRTALPDLW